MLILSNGLTNKADEGFLKVANSLVKRIKNSNPDTFVISYERSSEIADCYLNLNKLFLNKELISEIRKKSEPILYIPFPAKSIAAALRIFILSLYSKKRVNALLVMMGDMNRFAKALIKLSGANIFVLSKSAEDFYKSFLPRQRVFYIKAGVDTQKFVPIDEQKAKELKVKYGFEPTKPVVLHVGHLKYGRNVNQLLKIDEKYQVLLVTSTLTQNEQDAELKRQLLSCSNIKIIDSYIETIEEIYQLADVYFFPTVEKGNCIDVPLSCLEAASCNKPVITTDYGEMNELAENPGFYLLKSFDKDEIDRLTEKAFNEKQNTRKSVLAYDWDNAVLSFVDKCKF